MFLVKKISNFEDYREMQIVLENWQIISEIKREKAPVLEKDIFLDLSNFAEMIKKIPIESLVTEEKRIWTTFNSVGVLQGVAVVEDEDEELRLNFLISNPKNILSSVNKEERERGAGTATIFALFRECLKLRKTAVCVEATQFSSSFYEKFGFEGLNFSFFMEKQGEMRIASEKIQSMLKKFKHFVA